jgi:hypothetical protein
VAGHRVVPDRRARCSSPFLTVWIASGVMHISFLSPHPADHDARPWAYCSGTVCSPESTETDDKEVNSCNQHHIVESSMRENTRIIGIFSTQEFGDQAMARFAVLAKDKHSMHLTEMSMSPLPFLLTYHPALHGPGDCDPLRQPRSTLTTWHSTEEALDGAAEAVREATTAEGRLGGCVAVLQHSSLSMLQLGIESVVVKSAASGVPWSLLAHPYHLQKAWKRCRGTKTVNPSLWRSHGAGASSLWQAKDTQAFARGALAASSDGALPYRTTLHHFSHGRPGHDADAHPSRSLLCHPWACSSLECSPARVHGASLSSALCSGGQVPHRRSSGSAWPLAGRAWPLCALHRSHCRVRLQACTHSSNRCSGLRLVPGIGAGPA